MDLGIEDKVALVCGASKGLRRGIAAALAAEGARVAITSRSRDRIEAAASELGAQGFVHDSADVDAVPALVEAVDTALGPVDILITNTGGPPGGPDALAFTREQWEDAYLAGMRERGWGRVLNVSSSAVREPIPVLMLSNSDACRVQDARPPSRGGRRHAELTARRAKSYRSDRRDVRRGLARAHQGERCRSRPGGAARQSRGVRRRGRVSLFRARRLHHTGRAARRRRAHPEHLTRCRISGVVLDHYEVPFDSSPIDPENRLVRAARPVLDRLG
jgi:hypothetical protein